MHFLRMVRKVLTGKSDDEDGKPKKKGDDSACDDYDLYKIKEVAGRHKCSGLFNKICYIKGKTYDGQSGRILSKSEAKKKAKKVSDFARKLSEYNWKPKPKPKKEIKKKERDVEKLKFATVDDGRQAMIIKEIAERHQCKTIYNNIRGQLHEKYREF